MRLPIKNAHPPQKVDKALSNSAPLLVIAAYPKAPDKVNPTAPMKFHTTGCEVNEEIVQAARHTSNLPPERR